MIRQTMSPERAVFFAGETIVFTIEGTGVSSAGRAVVRTNLGRASVRREEIIAHTETGTPVPEADWHDIPMERKEGVWEIRLPLTEVGVFEAKCCFIPGNGGRILWPSGENFRFKVEPAGTACANSIYSAFVRQFGPLMDLAESPGLPGIVEELDKKGFTVIPPSGTFRNLIARLDHVFDVLGCRILQLLPVHPVPAQYGRMGRYGSPFASLDYFDVDPALADFDERATPLEQFCELIDAVHARDGLIFMDIPVNHTGWASKLQTGHPEYFVRGSDGKFESPGAWGVVWADLCKLNYREPKVHELMARVFLFWCARGVDGFRCDAGYMLPPEAWEYITSRVRREYPDTVFLLEGLGGPADRQELLLSSKGLDWGYSELFQNYSRDEISRYQPYMENTSHKCGALVSFAETHDNPRLAASGKTYAQLRFLVCSLLSAGGAFGFANGAEFFASEKIDVHGCGALNFGARKNLCGLVRKLTGLLAGHPAFFPEARTVLVQTGGGNVIAALRTNGECRVLVLLNLDCGAWSRVHWKRHRFPAAGIDLLTGREIRFGREGEDLFFDLAPGEGLCIGFDPAPAGACVSRLPARIAEMRTAQMARQAVLFLTGDPAAAGRCPCEELSESPEKFVERWSGRFPAPLVTWCASRRDWNREVMLAPGDVLLVEDDRPFRCVLRQGDRAVRCLTGVPVRDGRWIALAGPDANTASRAEELRLDVVRFPAKDRAEHLSGVIVLLPEAEKRQIAFSTDDVVRDKSCVFCADASGSYALFPAAWGEVRSKYHAILALNGDPRYPVDRRVLFSGLKAWLVTNDYSQEITSAFLERFTSAPDNCAKWDFMLPAGQGCRTALEVRFAMAAEGGCVRYTFRRHRRPGEGSVSSAKLILRPEIEDRENHQVTKAFTGPEHDFSSSVHPVEKGFDFRRPGCALSLRCDRGRFVLEPEWHYMCHLPDEAYYGLESCTDRYSPGFFEISLPPDGEAVLTASAALENAPSRRPVWPAEDLREVRSVDEFLVEGLRRFVVRRDDLSTVLAGYPWFLDWGRDTLIVLRGLVRSDAFRAEAVRIIRAFAGFERGGTIPNVIRGQTEANRDTSDAPLYLIVAVRDYIDATGDGDILKQDCAGRALADVLDSIVKNYMRGTANGIGMDEKSKLVFSPAHFSWMDTNFPAGTPRCGYPVEIQALWYAALKFLGYEEIASEVSASIEKYFFLPGGRCSDCLHCASGTPAAKAVPDDHDRCNQLLAVTLGAVKDPVKAAAILSACGELLVPGAIRTLADRPVRYKLPVSRDGRLLNDPERPYMGRYCGPEDTQRKVAYHNGTAWCWPFPAYCEALVIAGGEAQRPRARALLMSAAKYFETGIFGQLPEVADGDAPHTPGGCPAQAWSLSEFYRVYELLKDPR
ncbi:MAG: glycogen debranching enzyme N-terminal domain-containing protein [Lentisphaeria bacterium]|nr:glycogen debranching enzyme N-terminal domain-containing protein [Lentisphaeria bacterium]